MWEKHLPTWDRDDDGSGGWPRPWRCNWPGPGTASGQETRAEVLRKAREEKQREIEPYKPGRLQTTLGMLERGGVPLITRDGVYLKFGSLTTGSGFAFGTGYRTRRLFRREGLLDVWGGASFTG